MHFLAWGRNPNHLSTRAKVPYLKHPRELLKKPKYGNPEALMSTYSTRCNTLGYFHRYPVVEGFLLLFDTGRGDTGDWVPAL